MNTRLSHVVPAYNEGGRIGYGLERLMEWSCPDDTEIIVIDDGSTDDTAQKAKVHLALRLLVTDTRDGALTG